MDLSTYWNQPSNEQQAIIDKQQPAIKPSQCTLLNIFEEEEFGLAVCASFLFVFIVEDRHDLGGGFCLTITALGKIETKFFDDLEQLEAFMAEKCPYEKGAPVWVPLPAYDLKLKNEIESIKAIWPVQGEQTQEREQPHD